MAPMIPIRLYLNKQRIRIYQEYTSHYSDNCHIHKVGTVNSQRPGTITRSPCLKPLMMAAMMEFCRNNITLKTSIYSSIKTVTTMAKSLKWTLIPWLCQQRSFQSLKCKKVVFLSVKEQSLLRHDVFLPLRRAEIWDPGLFCMQQIGKT